MLRGQRIRDRREQIGLSQEALGHRIGKDGQYVSKLERGIRTNITTDTLEQLAAALVCSADYILGLAEDPRPRPH